MMHAASCSGLRGRAREVIFTSGGTEAITLILGSAGKRPGRIAISAVEHLQLKKRLSGYRTTEIGPSILCP